MVFLAVENLVPDIFWAAIFRPPSAEEGKAPQGVY
jgi:hypothetical protein